MNSGSNLAKKLINEGHTIFIGVPCSRLKGFLKEVGDKAMFVTSESEAVMIAAGMATVGYKPVVFLQNSGIGDVLEPLASFAGIADVGIVFVVSRRGGPGDEVHHMKMFEYDKIIESFINKESKVWFI